MPRALIIQKLRAALEGITPLDSSPVDINLYKASPLSLLEQFKSISATLAVQTTTSLSELEQIQSLKKLIQAQQWTTVTCIEPSLILLLEQCPIKINTNLSKAHLSDACITDCEALIAQTGSIVVSSKQARLLSIITPSHVIITSIHKLVPDTLYFFRQATNSSIPSLYSLIRGGSCTADIEKTLVKGAHGPKSLFVILREL
jgi:L-lactate dehydrogenase complex protein LldG